MVKIITFHCAADKKDDMDKKINEFFKDKEIIEFHPKVTLGHGNYIYYTYFFLYRLN